MKRLLYCHGKGKTFLNHLCLALLAGLALGLFNLNEAAAQDPPQDYKIYLPLLIKSDGGVTPPPPPPPPPPAEARFFVEPAKKIGSAGLAIDLYGGIHLAYADWIPDNQHPKAIYAYCPPTADCTNQQNWSRLALSTDRVNEVQLAVTPTGQPRLLIRATSTIYTAIAPGKDFFYAACDQNCTSVNGWTVTYLLSNHGTSSFDVSDNITPQRYFALDPQGRPRFIYQDNNYFYLEPDHLGAYYVYCDDNCTDSANWYETLITLPAQYDYEVMKYPSLAFTSDGKPRVVAYLIPLGGSGDGIYYFNCDAVNCGDGTNWQRVGLYARGNGTSASWDLELDSANRPRFAFYQGEGLTVGGWEKLHYIWCNSNCLDPTSWDNAEVGLPIRNGENPDLEIDSQGRPQLAYIMQGGGGTGYSRCVANCETQQPQWQHKVLDTATSLQTDYPSPIPPTCQAAMWDSLAPVLTFNLTGQPRVAHDAAYNTTCEIDENPDDNIPPQQRPWQLWHSVRVAFTAQP